MLRSPDDERFSKSINMNEHVNAWKNACSSLFCRGRQGSAAVTVGRRRRRRPASAAAAAGVISLLQAAVLHGEATRIAARRAILDAQHEIARRRVVDASRPALRGASANGHVTRGSATAARVDSRSEPIFEHVGRILEIANVRASFAPHFSLISTSAVSQRVPPPNCRQYGHWRDQAPCPLGGIGIGFSISVSIRPEQCEQLFRLGSDPSRGRARAHDGSAVRTRRARRATAPQSHDRAPAV